MALNKVEICGVDTSKLPLLKEEEKNALFAKIKAGDEGAKEQYIKGNLRLVLSVIKRFTNSNENPDDLFQIGCIGLIKAINNFNTELDVKFSTYAVPMIIGEIRRYMRDNNSIRVSRSLRDTALLLVKDIVIRSLRGGVMPYDAAHDAFAVSGLEEPVAYPFRFRAGGRDLEMKFAGIADRIDTLDDGALRVRRRNNFDFVAQLNIIRAYV